jgi:hypothetical protein
MTASGAKSAFGVTLTRDEHLIAEITNFPDVKMDSGEIDVTSHDSDNGFKEYLQGLRDGGSVPIEGNFRPDDTDGQIGLETDYLLGTLQSFVITFPSAFATTWTFTAFVKDFGLTGGQEKQGGFAATLRISGKPVLAISASADATTIAVSVGTLVPAWDGAIYAYGDAVVAGTANLTFTVTHGTAATITLHNSFTDGTSSLTTGVASGAQTLDAVDTITTFTITCTVSGKVPKVYVIDVIRAAA